MRKLLITISLLLCLFKSQGQTLSYVSQHEAVTVGPSYTGNNSSGLTFWGQLNYWYSQDPTYSGCDNAGGSFDECGNCISVGQTPCTPPPYVDCAGVTGGSAVFSQECNTCIGGNTGLNECPPACPSSGASITWNPLIYNSNNTDAESLTSNTPFTAVFKACADVPNGVWRLRVISINGGASTTVTTAGNRNPFTSPPLDEAEAQEAVTVMKAYYSNGFRGTWHTEAASRTHEEYHYSEWKCSSEHYWPLYLACLEQFTVPYTSYTTDANALSALMAKGVAAKLTSFTNDALNYWSNILPDDALSRPYAAGQGTLNLAIIFVQNLATANGWNVASGINTPNTFNPCFLTKPSASNISTCN